VSTPLPAGSGLDFDVVVVGAEPGGIAAAVSAARAGARTLLIDQRNAIGGLWTLAKMNTLDIVLVTNAVSGQKSPAQRGILRDIMNKLGMNYLGWERYFDVSRMQEVLDKLVQDEPMLTVMLNTRVASAVVGEGQPRPMEQIEVILADGTAKTVTGRVFVDGTDDADLVALLGQKGEDYFIGRSDFTGKDEMMAATLMLEVKGTSGLKGTYRDATDEINSLLFANDDRVIIGAGFNIGWQRDGSVLLSSLKICGVNGLDEKSVREALRIGKDYAPKIVAFLNGSLTGKAVKGFEHARLVSTSDYLYIRETRHIIGLEKVTFWNIIQGVIPADTIALGTYPIDLQPWLKAENPYTYSVKVAHFPWEEIGRAGLKHRLYGIPLGALIPKNIDNLLVVGRPISADSIAAGSIRVMSHAVAMGEAAGAAAAFSFWDKVSIHDMAANAGEVERVRTYLVSNRGFLLDPKGYKPE
jgi:ribulose 1,5-bisphosphate synthetase/thiazole synthase